MLEQPSLKSLSGFEKDPGYFVPVNSKFNVNKWRLMKSLVCFVCTGDHPLWSEQYFLGFMLIHLKSMSLFLFQLGSPGFHFLLPCTVLNIIGLSLYYFGYQTSLDTEKYSHVGR
jgi:hypothetical protein